MKEFADPGKVEIKVGPDDIATMQASDIVSRLVPEWLAGFLAKNRKYREVDNSLGAKGVFPDIWRKVGILKSRIWLGHEEIGEPSREVIQDLIGHLFLMLFMMDDDELSEQAKWDLAQTGPITILEGQGYALDRAADRMARRGLQPGDKFPSLPQMVERLEKAIADAQRGHRTAEWESVASVLASAATQLVRSGLPLAQMVAWDEGYLAADNGQDNDNPYKR